MYRRLSRVLIVALCASILAACGGSAGAPADSPRQAPPSSGRTDNGGQAAAPTSAPAPTSAAAMATQPPSAPEPAMDAAQGQVPPPMAGAISPQGDQVAPPVEPAPSQGNAPPPAEDVDVYDSTFFKNYGTNPFVSTAEDAQSTFAMDIDSASYGVMRRFINDGHLPDPDSVRVEEYLNYFNYDYPQPESGDFAIYTEAAPSQFGGANYEMVQIGIQGRIVEAAQRKPAALTFVIDASGSMAREDRLGTVKQALALLVGEMREDDTIAIVVYGSEGRSVLDPTSGAEKETILAALDHLEAEGSTNAEGGLRVGFSVAEEGFKPDGINMILLCSDGVANNGITDPEALLDANRRYLDKGIQLSTYGFGMGNFNDTALETLADKGNGSYAYIDTLDEAKRIFVENLTGSIETIARDAKIQVEFNPEVVKRYRLVGYENRDVADEDFRNDSVDAGEVGAGHSVTALYEIKRYPNTKGDIATIRIRYEKPDGGKIVEEAVTLNTAAIRPQLDDTTPRFKLATSVAQYAELLRHSQWAKGQSLEDVIGLANRAARGYDNNADVVEFVDLLTRSSDMAPPPR